MSVGELILTPEQQKQISAWKMRKSELEKIVADAQQELLQITRWLEAIALVAPEGGQKSAVQAREARVPAESMMDAIVRLVSAAPSPITKTRLRELLANEGFPKERLGNYFYTCIMRLKERQKIDVEPNGRVGIGIETLLG